MLIQCYSIVKHVLICGCTIFVGDSLWLPVSGVYPNVPVRRRCSVLSDEDCSYFIVGWLVVSSAVRSTLEEQPYDLWLLVMLCCMLLLLLLHSVHLLECTGIGTVLLHHSVEGLHHAAQTLAVWSSIHASGNCLVSFNDVELSILSVLTLRWVESAGGVVGLPMDLEAVWASSWNLY